MVIGCFFFVLFDLTVKLVGQSINGCVHIVIYCISEKSGATYVNGCLGFVFEFFDSKDALDVSDVVEVPFNTLYFIAYILTESIRNFDMVAA